MRHLQGILSHNAIDYSQNITQTAVALIFHGQQLLLIKRKVNIKDLHSGQLAFPGGKLEIGENSLQAAMRETYEEIGIQLNESQHLGRTTQNYLAYYLKNKKVKIAAHVFEVNEQQKYILSEHEVDKILLLNLEDITVDKLKVVNAKYKSGHIFAQSIGRQKYIEDELMHGFKYQQYPVFAFQQEYLYGLSWLILCHLFKLANIKEDVRQQTFKNYQFVCQQQKYSDFFTQWYHTKRLNQFK